MLYSDLGGTETITQRICQFVSNVIVLGKWLLECNFLLFHSVNGKLIFVFMPKFPLIHLLVTFNLMYKCLNQWYPQ